MKVHVRLFANLRERVPGDPREHRGRTSIDLKEGATLQNLLDHFDISRKLSQMVLINGQQASREPAERTRLALHDGDTVAVFPPLAGG
jgi:molybdopterin converting factor small subunit